MAGTKAWAAALAGAWWAAVPADDAMAQPGPATISVAPSDPYRFPHAAIVAPPTLDGLPRTTVERHDKDYLDLSARYGDGNEDLSVHVFLNVGGAVPVWFDRAIAKARGEASGGITPTAFTPPGQSTASGLMAAWSPGNPPLRATALAMLPAGDWYVAVRYRSARYAGAALVARLPAVLAALEWPRTIASAPAAAPIGDCTTPLAFAAAPIPIDHNGAISIGAILGGATPIGPAANPPTVPRPVTWCRDATRSPVGGVYRADEASDAYLLALDDAGRGVQVEPDDVGPNLARAGGNSPRVWTIQLRDLAMVSNYPPMTGLPRPDRIMAAVRGEAMTTITTWGGKNELETNTAFFHRLDRNSPAKRGRDFSPGLRPAAPARRSPPPPSR